MEDLARFFRRVLWTSKPEDNYPSDENVESVRSLLLQRMHVGYRKYGVTTERTDIDLAGWLQHLQEELLDAAVYVERLKKELT